jgi:glycosyltransferase involved in cell wall biosynthesis/Tfp pilus assembly protein PilF
LAHPQHRRLLAGDEGALRITRNPQPPTTSLRMKTYHRPFGMRSKLGIASAAKWCNPSPAAPVRREAADGESARPPVGGSDEQPGAPPHDIRLRRSHMDQSETAGGGVLGSALAALAVRNGWLMRRYVRWLRKRGEFELAIEVFRDAVRFPPYNERLRRKHVHALVQLAGARLEAGDLAAAVVAFDEAHRLAPERMDLRDRCIGARIQLARARCKAGDLAAAVVAFDEAHRLAPERTDLRERRIGARIQLARARYKTGDLAAAIAVFDEAHRLAPERTDLRERRIAARIQLARARCKAGDPAAAAALLEEVLVAAPMHLKLLAARAEIALSARWYAHAFMMWRDLTEAAPQTARGWIEMARVLRAMGRLDDVDQLIDDCLKACADQPERFARAACVALHGRRHERFTELAQQAYVEMRSDAAGLHELARLLLAAGETGTALARLDEVCALKPENKRVAATRSEVQHQLRLCGVEADALSLPGCVGLRMPDLALRALIHRAPQAAMAAAVRKIAVVCPSLGPGGALRQVMNTLHLLQDQGGWDLTVIPMNYDDTPSHRLYERQIEEIGARVAPYDDAKPARAGLGEEIDPILGLLPRRIRTAMRALARQFLSDRPHVVHAWVDRPNVVAGIAALLAGVPRVILSARSEASGGMRVLEPWFRTAYREMLARPNVVLVNNSRAGSQSYARWLDIDPARIHTVYNGVDLDGLAARRNPEVTRRNHARLGLPQGASVVGSLFRLSSEKRPMLWVEAAAEVARRWPSAHFVVLGEGPLRESMAAYADQLRIADRLRLLAAEVDVFPWYELMDVVVLTSAFEGTPNVLLEAQALGIPVVAPDVGGTRETFSPGVSGLLVDANCSPRDIADAVIKILVDDAWRADARTSARLFVREHFSMERLLKETKRLYDPADPLAVILEAYAEPGPSRTKSVPPM